MSEYATSTRFSLVSGNETNENMLDNDEQIKTQEETDTPALEVSNDEEMEDDKGIFGRVKSENSIRAQDSLRAQDELSALQDHDGVKDDLDNGEDEEEDLETMLNDCNLAPLSSEQEGRIINQSFANMISSDDTLRFSTEHTGISAPKIPVPKPSICGRIKGLFNRIFYMLRNPYETYVDFMYHIFNLSFGMLMLYFTVIFYVQCITFTFFIYAIGLIEPECVLFDGATLGSVTSWFDGCWTLSWTTFTTVGYGNTAPAISDVDGDGVTIEDPEKCIMINTLLMIVSFVGVVYSGAAGAILYSKVEKIKSEGQVSFSDPCVIRFGSGLIPIGAENESKENVEGKAKNYCPCPVLEFRILNHNHHSSLGVIANSELHCLSSVEDERETTGLDQSVEFKGSDLRVNLPRRLFSTMELINSEHPFFRRCWTATHVIDEKSPLIKKKMREIIKKNDGFWPEKYNNAKTIKRLLNFKEIIVNFTGVSKRTSKDVYAQRVYDVEDVIVGYQFINVLNKNGTDVEVRGDLLNDITQQNGDDPGENLDSMLVSNF